MGNYLYHAILNTRKGGSNCRPNLESFSPNYLSKTMKYKVELFISASTNKAQNKCYADVDSFLVQVLEEQGIEVDSILSHKAMPGDWIKKPHNLHRGN